MSTLFETALDKIKLLALEKGVRSSITSKIQETFDDPSKFFAHNHFPIDKYH